MMTRRSILKGSAALAAAAAMPSILRAQAEPRFRIGSCSIGIEQAKAAGLDGVEVGVGGAADTLQIADPKTRERYKEQMQKTGLVISSFMMGLFNSYPLATDPRGPAWLEQSIDAAADLKAKVILVAFFGKGSLLDGRKLKAADVDEVVKRIKAAAPRAKDKGVILGIENTLSAQQNVEILERINNDAVQIYYDVYNLTGMGYDVPAEIRFLKEKIAIFHFKNGPQYLGEGKLQFDPIRDAMNDINYKGWIVLETSSPSKDGVADARKNADFIRKLFKMA